MVKRIIVAGTILLAFLACGCDPLVTKPSPVQNIVTPTASLNTRPSAYRIGVGDEIEIKFFFTPELNDRLTVRPDGKISIMFAQDVQAAGTTAEDLADLIKRKLAPHINQLDLVVIVRTFASQKIYVSGEVSKPGPVQYTARENLLQVINDAGWITPLANHDQIMLVRRSPNGQDAIYPIDFKKILNGEDMSQNITLQPGDLVLVPPSDVVRVDRWVDQYIRQMIPVGAGVFINGGGR